MKQSLFLMILTACFRFLAAQEPVRSAVLPSDSDSGFSHVTDTPLLFQPGLTSAGLDFDLWKLSSFTPEITILPPDLSGYLKTKWLVTFTSGHDLPFVQTYPWFTPLWGTLFNQAVFQASDKLKIGGNSFGVNSLLNVPVPYGQGSRFECRGVSVFLEYKISDNFRIGGGVTVTGRPDHP